MKGFIALLAVMSVAALIPGIFAIRAKKKKTCIVHKSLRQPFRFIYPLAHSLATFLRKKGHEDLFGSPETIRKVTIVSSEEDPVDEYNCRIISVLYLLFVGVCAVLAVTAAVYENPLINGKYLKRASTGEGVTSYELSVEGASEELEITVDVSEKRCPPEELEDYFEEAYECVKEAVKGSNASLDEIGSGMDFITEVPGYSVKVTWEDIDYTYFYPDGDIRTENVTEPVIVYLTARLTYFEEERLFSFPVRLIPVQKSAVERFREKLEALLTGADGNDSQDGLFELPSEVEGEAVTWKSSDLKDILLLGFLGIAAVFLLIPGFRADLRNKEKERDEQMLRDYPEIICKYVMLLSAGMTCRGAWKKVCEDYRTRKQHRFAYEEMLKTENEMAYGVSESTAYEHFGTRCAIRSYQRFGSLLSRNVRRGSRDLIRLLEEEADESVSVRKEGIRTGIEEAGTKLLLPMGGMLCIVLAIILVPAFSSF